MVTTLDGDVDLAQPVAPLLLDEVMAENSNLKVERDALYARLERLTCCSGGVDGLDYFRAFKLVREGRIGDALYEMEQTLDRQVRGWRGLI